MESMNSKRYLSALDSEVDGVGKLRPEAGEVRLPPPETVDVGRMRPEGAEHIPPAVPPRIDKIDINSGECYVFVLFKITTIWSLTDLTT